MTHPAPALSWIPFLFPQGEAAPHPDWRELLHLSAEGRLRAESTFDQLNGEDRHRGRMRLRLDALYDVSEELVAEARLSTASDGADPNNPHWDFGDGSEGTSGGSLVLDRFQIGWKPDERWQAHVGKFAHQLTSLPVVGELAWDADIQPAGASLQWSSPARDGGPAYDLRAVEYVLVENSADSDPTMFGLQGNLSFAAGGGARVQLASSLCDWSSLAAGSTVFQNQGNSDVAGDFRIWQSSASASWEAGPLGRSQLFATHLKNLEGEDGLDTGYALGALLGRSGHARDLNLFAAYYDLEADALFSPVGQDDTPIAGTGTGEGMSGWILGGQYHLTDELSIKLWALTSDVGEDSDPYRLRLDLDFRIP